MEIKSLIPQRETPSGVKVKAQLRNGDRNAPPAQDNFMAVLEKQNAIMERFLATNGAYADPEQPLTHVTPTALKHKSMPLEYNVNSLRRLVTPTAAQRRDARQKHDLGTLANNASHHPSYELGFFQDCALDPRLMTLIVQPQNSIINMIPVRPNNNINHKHGFLTKYTVADIAGTDEPTTGCEPCIQIGETIDACTISYPYGRLCRGSKTLETNELIRRACAREFDDFLFTGDLYGGITTPFDPFGGVTADQARVIQWGALRKQFFNLARYYQLWLANKVWSGDPANNVGTGYKEFYGLLKLINGDYAASGLPLTSLDANLADCGLLSSDIKNFASRCINDGDEPTIWEYLQEMENTLYMRAQALQLLPVQWGIFMISPLWNELVKVLPCQMVADGCAMPTDSAKVVNVQANDGGSGLFNLSMRQQMLNSMTLTINGRTYPVYLEDALPYTKTTGPLKYTSDIFFIPFTAGGEEVLYWEHIDYSELSQQFDGLPGSAMDALGWTDNGRFHHAVTYERWCFEIQTKMEARLIFKAPQLAGRIQNVCASPLQQKPMAFNGSGTYAPTLGG